MPPDPVIALAIVLGVLVAVTTVGIARIEAAHPPTGQFIEIDGVRLHVAEIGLARGTPGAEPAVVLIHGASGNMEDMRLALGERLAASHRVILIDRPGHGWSSRPAGDTYASPARQAEIVAKALKQLGGRARDPGRPFVGRSPGRRPTRSRFRIARRASSCSPPSPILGRPIRAGTDNTLRRCPALVRCFYARFVYPLVLSWPVDLRAVSSSLKPCLIDYLRRAAIRLVLRPRHSSPTRATLRCSRVSSSRRRRLTRHAPADDHHRRRPRYHGPSGNKCPYPRGGIAAMRSWCSSRASDTCRTTPRPRRWPRRSTSWCRRGDRKCRAEFGA